eukprot:SM000212S06922  [mRNA]  locus=s212:103536:106650:- [translate_table: standard]
MIGVWVVSLWQQMGSPAAVNLVELGPGRGTLMADLLRGTSKFADFASAVSLHLVEVSPTLRAAQQQALCFGGRPQSFHEAKESPAEQAQLPDNGSKMAAAQAVQGEAAVLESNEEADAASSSRGMESSISGARVFWHADLAQVPSGVPTIMIAHEFFDALPLTERGWCERLIDMAEEDGGMLLYWHTGVPLLIFSAAQHRPYSFRYVLSNGPSTATRLYLPGRLKIASLEERARAKQIEVCPGGLKLAADIAKRVGQDGGGALIIDYGEDNLIADSLQACPSHLFLVSVTWKHEFVHLFDEPGSADLSAYVDFAALRQAVEEADAGAQAYHPITQSNFLGLLGINFRLEALLQAATDEQVEALQLGYWRLVGSGEPPWLDDTDIEASTGLQVAAVESSEAASHTSPPSSNKIVGMGDRYKVMAIVNSKLDTPACFV